MRRATLLLSAIAISSGPILARQPVCPTPDTSGNLVFDHQEIAMRTGLNVNVDGAGAAYTPGNHGYTYIQNGVNLRDGGAWIGCRSNFQRCQDDWLAAEAKEFSAGTPEFCAFALEVEPIPPAPRRMPCNEGADGYIVGNGLGRPVMGQAVPALVGNPVVPYTSMTYLRHMIGGQVRYLDAATVPALVAPRGRSDLVGAIAWVRFNDHDTFAIVGDTGPAFGEGTIALHQLLVTGRIDPGQPVGPIPSKLRCQPNETSLIPPFESRPDDTSDNCSPGHVATSNTDIRAYASIAGGVDSVILTGVRPPMGADDKLVTEEITPDSLRAIAEAAGYSRARLATMANCLGESRR